MRRYETIYIARPGSGEKEIASITERTTQTITSRDGSIVTVDNWGIKKLAYPINNEQQGYYVYIEYAGLPEAVAEIERLFRIDDKIIRYITVKTQDVFSHIPSDDKPEESEQSESLTEKASSEVAEEVTDQETSIAKPEEPEVADTETSDEPAEDTAGIDE
jgi:small subunit ribosomal protein S6